MASWSVQDAKNRFSEVITAARKAPQTVTKHGKPAVVVVDAGEYQRLRQKAQGKLPNLIEHLLAMPKTDTDDGEFDRGETTFRDLDF